MAAAEELAQQLDSRAFEQARLQQERQSAQAMLDSRLAAVEERRAQLARTESTIEDFERRLSAVSLEVESDRNAIRDQLKSVRGKLDQAREDLRIIETLGISSGLQRTQADEHRARRAQLRAEERLGIARRAEQRAQALSDAARRTAGETLDSRLDRVLPLMTELYRRLRPHPLWEDIEYKIRGDVRRFLKLQVGDDLNPQFIFSSGQRRATGLAFLLSVNLALSWSRWSTILLDDPVQHVDDFRSIHLAEVMAQLAASGRQVICAVEDPALADLLCRRLPARTAGDAKRITLGPGSDGALSKVQERELAPLLTRTLVAA